MKESFGMNKLFLMDDQEPFILSKVLGQGSFGCVYLMVTSDGETVGALKVFKKLKD
jgi:hypothetical protein